MNQTTSNQRSDWLKPDKHGRLYSEGKPRPSRAVDLRRYSASLPSKGERRWGWLTQSWVWTLALLGVALACLQILVARGSQRYQAQAETAAITAPLEAALRAQEAYMARSGRYAGRAEALTRHLSPRLVGRLRVIAVAGEGGAPGFVAEFCDRGRCALVDQSGLIRWSSPTTAALLSLESQPTIGEAP